MQLRLFPVAFLLIIPAFLFSQTATPKATNQVTITGCLTKTPHGDYELVDQKGVHNLVYSSENVDLESHVGQSVSLTGEQSAMPSTDTGTARPMPHFVVRKLKQESAKCDDSSDL